MAISTLPTERPCGRGPHRSRRLYSWGPGHCSALGPVLCGGTTQPARSGLPFRPLAAAACVVLRWRLLVGVCPRGASGAAGECLT